MIGSVHSTNNDGRSDSQESFTIDEPDLHIFGENIELVLAQPQVYGEKAVLGTCTP